MASLTNIKELFARFRFFIIATALILILAVVIAIQIGFKKPQPLTVQLEHPQGLPTMTASTKLDLNLDSLQLPREQSLLIIPKLEPLSQQDAKKIAQDLGFTQEPQVLSSQNNVTYFWKTNKNSLIIVANSREVKLQNQSEYPLPIKEQVNLDKSIDILSRLLNKLDINLSDYTTPQYTLFENLGSKTSPTAEKAHFIRLSFFQKINSLPIVSNTPAEHFSIDAVLDAKGNIISVSMFLSPTDYQESKPYSVKKFEQVVEDLRLGKGLVVYSRRPYESLGLKPAPAIVSVKITSATKVYLKTANNPQQLIPSILFEGEAALVDNKKEFLSIAVPVLENVQFVSP